MRCRSRCFRKRRLSHCGNTYHPFPFAVSLVVEDLATELQWEGIWVAAMRSSVVLVVASLVVEVVVSGGEMVWQMIDGQHLAGGSDVAGELGSPSWLRIIIEQSC